MVLLEVTQDVGKAESLEWKWRSPLLPGWQVAILPSLRQWSAGTSRIFLRSLTGASGWLSRPTLSIMAQVSWALQIFPVNGSEYLIQHNSEAIISTWHKAISEGIQEVSPSDSCSPGNSLGLLDPQFPRSAAAAEGDLSKVRHRLRKFLLKRPTLQSLREKGYIKGLDIDGLYRISGNLATIQKLRYKVDHDERLDLDDGRWEDVHVITGALKLFFRELPEPLFPFSHFRQFIAAIKLQDQAQRSRCVRDLVRSLPAPNHDTLRLLFQHLCRVVDHGNQNRMSVQSVAIVFGPTLLRPETEETSMPMTMVFQNQVVELILQRCSDIFPPH
ncbi:unnamed protein product [Nyctereutes procyonoides]|uniref:(raccoon dog) hypothetical protein n=1 Tax=Nyctereutes procyonoides TaxID=34880 RepID=A0A811YTA1_NYCPR|nr:unnamed protein product [Nyctereutes procyonoides]